MKHQAERIDQEVFGARDLGGNVGKDQVVPAMQGDQSITGGEIDPGLPLRSTDLVFDINGRLDGATLTVCTSAFLLFGTCQQSSQLPGLT